MKIAILSAAFFLLFSSALAQHGGKIAGSVEQNAKPAAGATVSLLRANDSATVKLAVANKEGGFVFEGIADGNYLVLATAVGHQKTYSKPFLVDPQQGVFRLPAINLHPVAKAMLDVTVTAKRPLVENKIDRTIVNVDASITNTGSSALEILEKAPGVSVDREGNITLKGKEGVMIMVDGRPAQLSGSDLANLLRTMNANQLDQIEIMTNPPARYDAAGTSGIINIKTKKTLTAGLNGSANVAYTQGRYPKTAEGFNFNYRNGKVNLYTNLSHNYQKRFSTMTLNRKIFNEEGNAVENIINQ